MRTAYLIVFFGLLAVSGHSDKLFVPGDYSIINQAVSAAVDGDTILIAPGTYVENVDFLDKAIVLVIEQGAPVTVIDGNQNGTAVIIRYVTGGVPVIEGFKVTNGLALNGGGISCMGCNPIIRNCIITLNGTNGSNYTGHGAGIFIQEASPLIENCTLSENENGPADDFDDGGCGGGIYAGASQLCRQSDCHRDCDVMDNVIPCATAFKPREILP
ncbi:MAG: hypothetical protein ABIK28_17805 [Planctomycetota bacterium]